MKPGILLGMDYLKHIKLRFLENLPSGYSVYDSTIGPFVCGQPNSNEGQAICAAAMVTTTESLKAKSETPQRDQELYEMVKRYFAMESAGYLQMTMIQRRTK